MTEEQLVKTVSAAAGGKPVLVEYLPDRVKVQIEGGDTILMRTLDDDITAALSIIRKEAR